MNEQLVKKVTHKKTLMTKRFYTTLLVILIGANLFTIFDTAVTNRNTRQVNEQLAELNNKRAELIQESERLNEYSYEIYRQLKEAIGKNREHQIFDQ